MMKKLLIPAVLIALTVSCQPKEDSLSSKIIGLEEQASKDLELDTALGRQLVDAYFAYAELHPSDSISYYYRSKAGDILKEMPNENKLQAIKTYSLLYEELKETDHPLAPRSVFMIGFVFDEKFGDKDRAYRSYSHFAAAYPNHPLADDARNLMRFIKNQDETDLEQIQNWIKQAETDTNQTN